MDNGLHESRILIVDDNPTNVELLEDMLYDDGYDDVESTTDPRQVCTMVAEGQFDLVLLDIRMPHMNGIQVMEALKQQLGDEFLPVLVLTAQTDQATRLAALEAGARDFLTKPFAQWEVLLRIRNMLESRIYYKNQRLRADDLEARVRERTTELRQSQRQIVQCLGRAGEYRDNETGAHVMRMSRSCQLLAQQVGMDAQAAEMLMLASTMHDVGKIGIPDQILLKPGRLTDEERSIMERHVTIGADIVMNFTRAPILEVARSVILHHHEKWDGSGYPHGLIGSAIPVEGRIAAVCDVFDALTSSRPYKQAWSVERAMSLLHEEAGSHFDPRLVSAFEQILPQVLQLRDELPDPDADQPVVPSG